MLGGAEGKGGRAEARVASIRGQVRWWHRKAQLQPVCNVVWGQTTPSVIGSKVSLCILPSPDAQHQKADILPHALDKSGKPRDALASDQFFKLRLTRLVGCSPEAWEAALKAVKLWLLLGTIGLRANRAAGSVWPVGDWVPKDVAALGTELPKLGYSRPVMLADKAILSHSSLHHEPTDALKLRHAASDTVKGHRQYFGEIQPRTPSPLKMKVIRLDGECHLLLTGLDLAGMAAARKALGNGKPLGSVPWAQLP
jgi:hypothetical protein